MWKSVSQALADQFGAYYNIKQKDKVHTGEMHEAWVLDDGFQKVFTKCNEKSFRSMFRAEADQLQLLDRTKTIKVPQVYAVGTSQNHSFLLLEALDLRKVNDNEAMAEFGKSLALLHKNHTSDNYGLDFDTWLGSVYQPNEWKSNWATFFAEQRIGWQLQLCKEKGIHFGDIDEIIKIIKNQLVKHKPQASLLHGNLWLANCAETQNEVVTFDPACYFGDRECDIAFTELFQPLPTSFYKAYNETYPLEEGYQWRKPLYQLYYLLNFSHRFKQHYIEQANFIIQSLQP